jgi:hypothetical protein
MKYEVCPHRFADVILSSDYALKKEIEEIIKNLSLEEGMAEFERENQRRTDAGKRPPQGKQSTINVFFRKQFSAHGWQVEKNVFKLQSTPNQSRRFSRALITST